MRLVSFAAFAALLSSSTLAAPQAQGGQVVLIDNSASPARAAPAAVPHPDFVDQLQAEADQAGVTIDWGLDHVAQKANEAAFQASQLRQAKGKQSPPPVPRPEFGLKHEPDFIDALKDEADRAGVTIDWGLDHVEQKANEAAFKLNKLKDANKNKDVKVAITGENAGDSTDALRVDRVNVVPDPPKPGQALTVKGAGLIRSLIDDGTYVDVTVKLGLIKLLSKRFDLCELARENDAQLQCPLEPGYYEIEHTVELPSAIPPAKFNVHVGGTSQADEDLTCLDLSIDFFRR